jgi:hypothetical protein
MKQLLKSYWKKILFFVLAGAVGGFFLGLYSLESYPAEMQAELAAQGITNAIMGVVTAAQSAGYGLVLGSLGIILSKKIGLWKDTISFAKKPLMESVVVSIIGGGALILLDICFFGKYSQAIMDSYSTKPTVSYILASVTYGAVIEEVMLRLFMMSLFAFVLHKLFGKGKEYPAETILIISNIVSALLFAAGHLPATQMLLGLSPMILLRCFLLNGGIGLLFGRLYRKHGLTYAMLAHGGCHVVSKLIWILFL